MRYIPSKDRPNTIEIDPRSVGQDYVFPDQYPLKNDLGELLPEAIRGKPHPRAGEIDWEGIEEDLRMPRYIVRAVFDATRSAELAATTAGAAIDTRSVEAIEAKVRAEYEERLAKVLEDREREIALQVDRLVRENLAKNGIKVEGPVAKPRTPRPPTSEARRAGLEKARQALRDKRLLAAAGAKLTAGASGPILTAGTTETAPRDPDGRADQEPADQQPVGSGAGK